jgi:hypothetical protein
VHADIQIGTVHGSGGQLGERFVIRSSVFEKTVAKPATAMIMRPTKTATMLRARLDSHADDFSDGSGRVRYGLSST